MVDDPDYKPHGRDVLWNDVNEADIKIFFAHLLIMGLVRKSKFAKYWSKSKLIHTPFFGKYMSRTRFELILGNLHISNNRLDTGVDPLFKLRPFIEMCERNFKYLYKPSKNLSLDEACCPFKGRLKFKVYNKSKPNKFAIKLYEVCEAETGYVLGFEVYTGQNSSVVAKKACPVDPSCTKTTKLVLGLLEHLDLLNSGFHIYMDNYYLTVELAEELLLKNTHCAGTTRRNRKGLPAAVKDAKLKRGECVFRRKNGVLALKWCDKRPVLMLSTMHDAEDILTHKKDKNGVPIIKPLLVHEYVKYMRGCDVSDQLVSQYSFLRRSVKWWRKLFFHLVHVVVNNAYVLNRKYGNKRGTHQSFIEHIAEYLISTSTSTATCMPKKVRSPTDFADDSRLQGRHFMTFLPEKPGKVRVKPVKRCFACNFSPTQVSKLGFPKTQVPRRLTSYKCMECEIALCVEPCFRIYHTVTNYRKHLLNFRLSKK